MKKAMKEIETLYPNIEIEGYDYDMDTTEVEKYSVGDILPVLIFFKEGKEVSRLIGEKTKNNPSDTKNLYTFPYSIFFIFLYPS